MPYTKDFINRPVYLAYREDFANLCHAYENAWICYHTPEFVLRYGTQPLFKKLMKSLHRFGVSIHNNSMSDAFKTAESTIQKLYDRHKKEYGKCELQYEWEWLRP